MTEIVRFMFLKQISTKRMTEIVGIIFLIQLSTQRMTEIVRIIFLIPLSTQRMKELVRFIFLTQLSTQRPTTSSYDQSFSFPSNNSSFFNKFDGLSSTPQQPIKRGGWSKKK